MWRHALVCCAALRRTELCCAVLRAADKTVKVWDVATQQCRHTLRHHSGKVQAVAWNPAEAPVLLSGGFDKQACLVRGAAGMERGQPGVPVMKGLGGECTT